MTDRVRVFVYGSLKRHFQHHDQMNGAEFIRDASLPGHALVLYEGGYPALCASDVEFDVVTGEVYWVDGGHLAKLDAFEDCPALYQRQLVTLEDGTEAHCYRISREQASKWQRILGTWVEEEAGNDLK